MRSFFRNIYYSFPVQLALLHFKRYQVLLIFWYILFSTIGSDFMKVFGADALFLAPEYLGSVNTASTAIVGMATGVFIMSWNITTFILHSRRCRFLATTTRPFFKYCLNNTILPFSFLLFYLVCAYQFGTRKEFIPFEEFVFMALGFVSGFFLIIAVSFAYFFTADKRIVRTLAPIMRKSGNRLAQHRRQKRGMYSSYEITVGYYFTSPLKFRKARDVSHYGEDFLTMVFRRHHFSAVISVLTAVFFLAVSGFFLDHKLMQLPAAASIIIFFALMIALMGAFAYFLRSWSIVVIVVLLLILNMLFRYDIIDPTNKAYGIDYSNNDLRPDYTIQSLAGLSSPQNIERDKQNMIRILNNWKARQGKDKPVIIFLNISGGGVRSACFAMNVLQKLDSVSKGGMMRQTFLITGASGGMFSGAYFRELYRQKNQGVDINLQNIGYVDDISGDLLNPIFSSMIARDVLAPVQRFTYGKFRYIKDRGYAFEQKLNENTHGMLNRELGDYSADEAAAKVPLMIFNSVITRDGRKLMTSTQPLSFMMKPEFQETDSSFTGADAVDFAALFQHQGPLHMRLLTALRMNATFPYILPNVWLPSKPIIDVMDAGMRDNYGQETTLRFIQFFRDWIKENTSGVLLVQVRDRKRGGWDDAVETTNILNILTKPATTIQHNWFKLQDIFQNDEISYIHNSLDSNFRRVAFMYIPEKPDKGVPMNFHLTMRDKLEVIASMKRPNNVESLQLVEKYFK